MVTWVTKKSLYSRLKLMDISKVTASKFLTWRLKRWENLILKRQHFLSEKCTGNIFNKTLLCINKLNRWET